MNLTEYLSGTGFVSDPFASTNAEDEQLLQSYFIPPPYFVSVLGQPTSPESHIVFAPRGGGKTAQRRMIEVESEGSDFICVLHDAFPVSGKASISHITVDSHLKEICRKVVLAVLVHLDERPQDSKRLSKETKKLFLQEVGYLLGPLSSEEFRAEIQSLKNLGQRSGEFIKAHAGPIKPVITAIFKKAELEPPDFDLKQSTSENGPPTESWKYRLSLLVEACQELGYSSVYILVDKVDELAETSADPKLAFDLVKPLITNLPVLEMKGIGFKVFLWDRAQNIYLENGGRPDRIRDFTLGWDASTLSEMMTRRLHAHSEGAVSSMNDLLQADVSVDLQRLCSELAHGSPRDMVRLAAEIRATHLNKSDPASGFDESDIFGGIGSFSIRVTEERYRKHMPDLMKVNSYRFTQGRLANDLLKIRKQSAQAKVAEWRRLGLAEKVSELQDARNRPQHLYGVVDTRVAIAMRSDLGAEHVLDSFVISCSSCGCTNVSDEPSMICIKCQTDFGRDEGRSLLAACRNVDDHASQAE